MLDTVREVITPEGVALRLPAAGPWLRGLAWLIDALLRYAVFVLGVLLFSVLGQSGMGLVLILLFVLTWGYPVLFEVLRDGQTPGKRSMGLRVVREDGAPVGWQASMVRNLLRVVDALPVGYGFGVAVSLLDPAGRRLGDIVAGTLVIHAPPASARKAIAPVAAAQDVSLHGVPMLLPHEQAAIIAFSERAAALTPERQQEIADLVPELGGVAPAQRVPLLHAIANRLLGR